MSPINYKKWLYGGITVLLASIVIGLLGIFWDFYGAFESLSSAETAGIGKVAGGIQKAFFFTLFSITGSVIGLILIIVGGIKAYNQSKSQS